MARMSGFRSSARDVDRTYAWKFILRTLAIFLALAGIIMLAWAITYIPRPQLSPSNDNGYNDDEYYSNYAPGDFLTLPWAILLLGLSLIWNLVNVIFVVVRKGRWIHPGANVGCDLILWLGLLGTGILATGGAYGLRSDPYQPELSSYNYGSGYGSGSSSSTPCSEFASCQAQTDYVDALHKKGSVVAAAATIDFIVLLIHFALFISACRYTHRRNHGGDPQAVKSAMEAATMAEYRRNLDFSGPGGGFIYVNSEGRPINHPSTQDRVVPMLMQQQQDHQTSSQNPDNAPHATTAAHPPLSHQSAGTEPSNVQGHQGSSLPGNGQHHRNHNEADRIEEV